MCRVTKKFHVYRSHEERECECGKKWSLLFFSLFFFSVRKVHSHLLISLLTTIKSRQQRETSNDGVRSSCSPRIFISQFRMQRITTLHLPQCMHVCLIPTYYHEPSVMLHGIEHRVRFGIASLSIWIRVMGFLNSISIHWHFDKLSFSNERRASFRGAIAYFNHCA